MSAAGQFLNLMSESVSDFSYGIIKSKGKKFPLMSWYEGSYECALVIELDKEDSFYSITLYGGQSLETGHLDNLNWSSDWSATKSTFGNFDSAKKHFNLIARTIKAHGGLAKTKFPQSWKSVYGIVDDILSDLTSP